ncbi:MAG: DUF4830 domain-containing protein, partial [Oscillospiraceae bacterium]|nr:DUF4830 domain-containing protein [Oscillospiraceae bacterium]
MFVYSVRSKRVKNVVLAVAGVAAIIALLLLTRGTSLTAGSNAMRTTASTAQERQAFLEQFGWEISEDPIEVSEIIIPAEFDEVFTRYNEIQLA